MSNRSLLHIDLFVKNPENLHLLSRMIQKKQEILTLRSRNQQMFDNFLLERTTDSSNVENSRSSGRRSSARRGQKAVLRPSRRRLGGEILTFTHPLAFQTAQKKWRMVKLRGLTNLCDSVIEVNNIRAITNK